MECNQEGYGLCLMENMKKLQLFWNLIGGLGFGVKQIIDSLSFLFLLHYYGQNNRANQENLHL